MLVKVLIAMVLGTLVGAWAGTEAGFEGFTYYQFFSLAAQLFLNALMLVMVPLVTSSIIAGTARMGGEGSFASLGGKTLSLFFATSLSAVLVGWGISQFLPQGNPELLASMSTGAVDVNLPAETGFGKVQKILLQFVPSNIIAAASQGQMLGLIFFSMLLGFFLTRVEPGPGGVVISFFQGLFQAMMKVTQFVMKALPVGVFFSPSKSGSDH